MMHVRNTLLLATLLLALANPVQALYILEIDPNIGTGGVGQTYDIDIHLDATLGDAIIGYGFDVNYDPAVLSVDDAQVDPVFDALQSADTKTPGAISFTGLMSPSAPPLGGSDIVLGSIRFLGLSVGTSGLTFAFPGFGAPFETVGLVQPIPPGGTVLPDQESPGSITVSAAPAPGTLLLILAGTWGLRRSTLNVPEHLN